MSSSGNSDIESAVNWLLGHESDPDIDQLPLVGYFEQLECTSGEETRNKYHIKTSNSV
jgi:UBX domain-containing protein 1/4